jgi:hypothetical protein
VTNLVEAHAKAEAYLEYRWRECPALLGLIRTTVKYTMLGQLDPPLSWIKPDEAVAVRNIYAHFGIKLPG